ncbi:CamS family sex pheromone protein [Marinilactibacillus kalidii]|uniref:CamS family sex pheromone protein n=1 Tax=Marinilactibacillus kalidii TaxID=2820274 RepID=UPI001ABE316C|nr:CamS family sex pheromone protein [Marinilactibacillus kalidii]
MNKKWLLTSMAGLAMFLASCDRLPNSDESDEQVSEQTEGGEEAVDSTDTVVETRIDDNYYRPLITEDGSYEPSLNRGITRSLNSNVNIKTFENDLMRLSHKYFSTEDHYFQEGQFLPADLATSWLRRAEPLTEKQIENGETILGLNPEDNGSEDPESRAPNYLSSILEQDFYTKTDDGIKLSGISIGLALNSVEYYGDNQQQPIPRDVLKREGQRIGSEVVSRMRQLDGVGSVPIMVGLYEQSTRDNFAGGVYISQGISQDGAEAVSDWTDLNEKRLVFPVEGMQSAEGNSFANFKSEVENFFPNLSGVTGIAHYVDDALVSLQIDIVTQFYGKGEIVAFTQYLNEAANAYLSENLPIEIKVESLNGIESFLKRDAGETEFNTHVFN